MTIMTKNCVPGACTAYDPFAPEGPTCACVSTTDSVPEKRAETSDACPYGVSEGERCPYGCAGAHDCASLAQE